MGQTQARDPGTTAQIKLGEALWFWYCLLSRLGSSASKGKATFCFRTNICLALPVMKCISTTVSWNWDAPGNTHCNSQFPVRGNEGDPSLVHRESPGELPAPSWKAAHSLLQGHCIGGDPFALLFQNLHSHRKNENALGKHLTGVWDREGTATPNTAQVLLYRVALPPDQQGHFSSTQF